MSIDVLTWPLRLGRDGRLASVEQGDDADLLSCVTCIVSTPKGWTYAQPEFGTRRDLFRQGGVDVHQLAQTITEFEPREPSPSIVGEAIDQALSQRVDVRLIGGA